MRRLGSPVERSATRVSAGRGGERASGRRGRRVNGAAGERGGRSFPGGASRAADEAEPDGGVGSGRAGFGGRRSHRSSSGGGAGRGGGAGCGRGGSSGGGWSVAMVRPQRLRGVRGGRERCPRDRAGRAAFRRTAIRRRGRSKGPVEGAVRRRPVARRANGAAGRFRGGRAGRRSRVAASGRNAPGSGAGGRTGRQSGAADREDRWGRRDRSAPGAGAGAGGRLADDLAFGTGSGRASGRRTRRSGVAASGRNAPGRNAPGRKAPGSGDRRPHRSSPGGGAARVGEEGRGGAGRGRGGSSGRVPVAMVRPRQLRRAFAVGGNGGVPESRAGGVASRRPGDPSKGPVEGVVRRGRPKGSSEGVVRRGRPAVAAGSWTSRAADEAESGGRRRVGTRRVGTRRVRGSAVAPVVGRRRRGSGRRGGARARWFVGWGAACDGSSAAATAGLRGGRERRRSGDRARPRGVSADGDPSSGVGRKGVRRR